MSRGVPIAAGVLLTWVVIGLIAENITPFKCRQGFAKVSRWCFYFHTEPTSMLNSSEICFDQGAHMAVLDSKEKEKAITTFIEDMNFFNLIQERDKLHQIARSDWDTEIQRREFCEDYKIHGLQSPKYRFISNAKIPLGSPPHHRANLTTPTGFSVKLSSIPGAGMGAFADIFVPKYTILGMYEGQTHTRDTSADLYSWQVDMQETNGTYIIDASDPACSNWLRFFNAPSSYEQENVVPVSCAGTIFYMASRDIEPGTELLVWYGDSYGRYLGVNRIHPENDLNGSFAFRANVLTFDDNDRLIFDNWAPVTYQNWFLNTEDEADTPVDHIFGLLLTYHHDEQWRWVAERNYSYYTGEEGLKLPFICEHSPFHVEPG
ncbi:uncharacterized protein LOC125660940 [Ostrea edulis]|uniref:uncharacterized protein LOC125660940 n=1 Tax=Ostrea edulis TaxID=37623 RepID=UPI0024AEA123|nr:uncharacterized protein LOC125660940 [Ostrea edulis]XP_056003895.1 uncharacterized protein LOC125660940 [Ostrea edulis]XP_056003896.1 uncharacterized protein LOC125660940 [Ostrea edulis]